MTLSLFLSLCNYHYEAILPLDSTICKKHVVRIVFLSLDEANNLQINTFSQFIFDFK